MLATLELVLRILGPLFDWIKNYHTIQREESRHQRRVKAEAFDKLRASVHARRAARKRLADDVLYNDGHERNSGD